MREFKLFIFYFLYLIAAELPFFLLLWLRNFNNNGNYLTISVLLLVSIIINISLFGLLYKNSSTNKIKPLTNMSNIEVTANKLNEGLNNFFAIFLLPFFAFNLSQHSSLVLLALEIMIIFLLLTVFLYRTKNILSNIFIYLLFNIYYGKRTGENFIIISPNSRNDLESNELEVIHIFDNYYLYSSNKSKLKRKIFWVILLLILLGLTVLLIVFI